MTDDLSPDLVLRSIGKMGYLKFPAGFSRKFQVRAETIPSPTFSFEDDGREVRLTFVWKREDLEPPVKE